MKSEETKDISKIIDYIKKTQREFGVGIYYTFDKLLRGCLGPDFNSRVALKILFLCKTIFSLSKESPSHSKVKSLIDMSNAIKSMNHLISRRLNSLSPVSEPNGNEKTLELEFISNITMLSNTVVNLASFLSNISKIYPIVEEESHDTQAEKDDHEKVQVLFNVQKLFDAFIKECKKESGSRMHEIFSNLNAINVILEENDESELSIDVSCLFDDVSQSKRMVSANVLKVLSDQIPPLPQINSPRSVDEQIQGTVTGPQLIDLLRKEVKDTLDEESLIEFMKEEGTQSTVYIMSLYYTLESIYQTNQITNENIQTIRSMVFDLDMYTRMIQDEEYKAEFREHHVEINRFLRNHGDSHLIGELSESEAGNENYQFQVYLLDKLANFLEISNLRVLASIDKAGPDPSKINSENRGWDSDTDNIDHPSPRHRLSI